MRVPNTSDVEVCGISTILFLLGSQFLPLGMMLLGKQSKSQTSPLSLSLPTIKERYSLCLLISILLKLHTFCGSSEGVKKEGLKLGYELLWDAGKYLMMVLGFSL